MIRSRNRRGFSLIELMILIFLATLTRLNDVTLAQCESTDLVPSNGVLHDKFGWAVDRAGNLIAIGAIGKESFSGFVYVYRFDGATWIEEAILLASDAESGDQFGWSVAISGDVIAVGANHGDAADVNDCGAAYVFRFNGETWIEEQKLTPPDPEEDDRYAVTIALEDGLLLVGATLDEEVGAEPGNGPGAAYVYRFNAGSWDLEQQLLASDGGNEQQFGTVALSGETALIGAWRDNDNGSLSGSAYIFRFDGSEWIEEVKLLPSDGAGLDFFGGAVSIVGDIALIGASGDIHDGIIRAGSAYVFKFDGKIWNEEAKLVAADAELDDHFGSSVAMGDGLALIGVPFESEQGEEAGSAYYFQLDVKSGLWDQIAKVTEANAQPDENFGLSVALDGEDAVIGSPRSSLDAGTALIYNFNETDCNSNNVCDVRELELGLSFDCNHNDVPDDCDLADGTLHDQDGSGIPDECEAMGDFDGDGAVGVSDLLILLGSWGPCDDCNVCPADLDDDCQVGTSDLLTLLSNWG